MISYKLAKQLKDLIVEHDFKDIRERLIELYPDQKGNLPGYENVFVKLNKTKPKKSEMRLRLDWIKEKGEENYIRVDGFDGKQGWAIEFISWAEWLGMEIEKKTLKSFPEIDIICHSLWEMTWSGFTEKQIQGHIKEIVKRVKDIKSGKAKSVPWKKIKK